MFKSRIVLLGSALMLLSLYGCGSDNREVASGTGSASYEASAACISCHAGNKTSPVTGALIVGEWEKSAHNLNGGAACTDCHTNSGHPNGGSIVAAVQDTQCGTCHTPASLGAAHFSTFANLTSAQYVSEFDAEGVQCRKCHNPHDTTSLMQYNRDWANSGHGDIHFVPGDTAASSVNSHYPWTTAGRDACSKCHTTSGYLNFLSDGAAPFLSSNTKNEAIMCSACHQDYSWKRRNIGAQTLEYKYNGVNVVLPDAGDSNLCLVCHGGRGNFQSARSSRFEGHHLPVGADLFAEFSHVGFEFTGQSYTKPAYFKHDIIGLADGSGPCVTCHMKSTKSHTFGVVTKDASGVITAINTQAVCNTCHTVGTRFEMTAAKLEEEGEGYKQAGVVLKALLANTLANYKGAAVVITTTTQANAASEGDYGSFQNSLYPTEDPGAFAHNRIYVKRLLFDSIDWMQHGAFTGSITISAATYPAAASWFGADATTGIASRP